MPQHPTLTRLRSRAAGITRRLVTRAAVRILTAVNPAPAAATTEKAPAGPAVVPSIAEIEAWAPVHLAAAKADRIGAQAKRKAAKTLKGLPAGVYGRVTIAYKPSTRSMADLTAIRATYARYGLGEVPMVSVAPSMIVTVTEASSTDSAPATDAQADSAGKLAVAA